MTKVVMEIMEPQMVLLGFQIERAMQIKHVTLTVLMIILIYQIVNFFQATSLFHVG